MLVDLPTRELVKLWMIRFGLGSLKYDLQQPLDAVNLEFSVPAVYLQVPLMDRQHTRKLRANR